MSVQETVIQKIFNKSIYHGYRGHPAENRLRSGTRDFRDWIRSALDRNSQYRILHCQNSNTNITVANREVHLEGYESHEDVIRAYLEFSGIDPDSKEGRFYFEL